MTAHCPSFFVIGAQKAGTSTLHARLALEPHLCLPKIKETHYFSDNARYRKGLYWYLNWFDCRPGSISGEVDPEYLFFNEVPERIKKVTSNPKFICIFRHPIDRAFSHYQMTKRRGYEDLSFEDALAAEDERISGENRFFALTHFSYMRRSLYAEQVLRYMRVFPESQFLFLTFDELVADNSKLATYARICKFLGIESVLSEKDFNKRINPSAIPKFTFIRDLIYGNGILKHKARPIIRFIVPNEDLRLKIAMTVDNLNLKPIKHTKKAERNNCYQSIKKLSNEETKKIMKLTRLDLCSWILEDS